MHYVYLLSSASHAGQRYVGMTGDLKARLKFHNADLSVHTAKYLPWKLVAYFAFEEERKAQRFEYYLKSGSGKAFANQRFW